MADCNCASLPHLAVVPMDGSELHERVFSSLETIQEHGGHQWWLYLSRCNVCAQDWMVAQDDRIYDNFYLKRLGLSDAEEIIRTNGWPDDFMTYEQVLRLGRASGCSVVFLDPHSPAFVSTAEDLRNERPEITVHEIAYLLAIEPRAAANLVGS